jgi:hypothetical protein
MSCPHLAVNPATAKTLLIYALMLSVQVNRAIGHTHTHSPKNVPTLCTEKGVNPLMEARPVQWSTNPGHPLGLILACQW